MMGFGFGGFGLIAMILFWVLVIGLAVWLVTRLFPQTANYSPPQSGSRLESPASPEDILKRRYAQGEISKSEFEEMREQLRH